ncbi:aromatic amino acid transport family protein [Shewanella sp. KJ2020]|uniref:aromatic amino acid transport family protein n=1 Tax=Shewanella sp. KJ2020 TaxID=2919172 RepID=UPI0020A6FCBA|nr:aromatic amino acid transport family protein [Shewanella sp. KJ2020]MCP3127260.1 aromatic amino acid transporter [Shewanella sp. KJ2020]
MTQNKFIGSLLLIAGTTIGAGMLALPIASAGLGFGTSSAIMLILWALMAYTALLMVEIHQFAPSDASLNHLAQHLLGRKGQLIANSALMFLLYALCAAYIAGGGEQINQKLTTWLGLQLPPQAGAVLFTLLVGTIVGLGTHCVDLINRGLFSLKIVALLLMLALLLPQVESPHLLELPLNQGLIITAIPVIFTSFGFHGSIPSVVRYLGVEVKALRRIMLLGSALPLMIYLLWQLGSQGVLSQSQLLENQSLSSFINQLASVLHSEYLSSAISLFADLALATSFLGVSLGLFDFMASSLRQEDNATGRSLTATITFLPPLGFALFYPQGFITALGYAAIALVILAIFLPVAMVWTQRQTRDAANLPTGYRVAGGKFALVLAGIAGIAIIAAQLLS